MLQRRGDGAFTRLYWRPVPQSSCWLRRRSRRTSHACTRRPGPPRRCAFHFYRGTAQENLISAAEGGDLSRVKALLAGRAKVNDKAACGTALIAPTLGGHLDVVRALLAAKANVNAKCPFRNFLNRLNQLGFKGGGLI